MEYFWYHRPDRAHPPAAIRDPAELTGSDHLTLSWTGSTESRRRALIRNWCQVLPQLQGVRLIWLVSRVPQALFEAACQVPGLEGLYIKSSGIKSIEALHEARTLRYVHLGSSPSIVSLTPASDLRQLKVLGVQNLKRIHDLSPLAVLSGLEELSVEGSMWTVQHVDTLGPIAFLTELRFLSLVNLRARDRTLKPLFSLRKLRRFQAAQWWDPAELSELRRLNPDLVS